MAHFHQEKKNKKNSTKSLSLLNTNFFCSNELHEDYKEKIGKALIIITELQKIQFEEIISGRFENIIIETSF